MSDDGMKNTFEGEKKTVEHTLDYNINEDFKKILNTLVVDVQEYKPFNTINEIKEYLKTYEELNVVYYGVITNLIYTGEEQVVGNLYTNIDTCLYIIGRAYRILKKSNDANLDDIASIYRFVIKISDHISLASSQVDKIMDSVTKQAGDNIDKKVKEHSSKIIKRINNKVNLLEKNMAQDKIKMKKFYKGLEKDSITILGIFVAIILAFIGSIIFPLEFIKNVSDISIARLILVFTGIAFIFINLLYLLIKFIVIINDKKEYLNKLSYISDFNWIVLFVLLISLIGVFYTDNIMEVQQSILENTSSSLDNKTK